MDGASSQCFYKQKYEDNFVNDVIQHEQSMFQTSVAHSMLTMLTVWQNKKPNSRPCTYNIGAEYFQHHHSYATILAS